MLFHLPLALWALIAYALVITGLLIVAAFGADFRRWRERRHREHRMARRQTVAEIQPAYEGRRDS